MNCVWNFILLTVVSECTCSIIVMAATTQLPTPVIGDKAYQLHAFQVPQCEFGKTSIVKPLDYRRHVARGYQLDDLWLSDHFSSNGSIAGLGYIMMQTKTLLSIHHCLLTSVSSLLANILFQQISQIGKMLLPSLTSINYAC